MERATEILNRVCEFLDADQIGYSLRDDAPVIDTGYRTESARFDILIFVHQDVLSFTVRMPLVVPEKRRVEMAETIARASRSLLVGGFKLDFSDGDLEYQVSAPIADASLTHEQFRALSGAALGAVDRYQRAFGRFCRVVRHARRGHGRQ